MKKKYLFGLCTAVVLAGGTMFALNGSISNQMKVESPLVTEDAETTILAPGKVTSISYTVSELADDNTADVTLTFTTPANHIADDYGNTFEDGLEELTLIEVSYYDNSVYKDVVIATLENPAIGEEVSVELADQPKGYNKYKITCYNSDNIALSISQGNGGYGRKAYENVEIQVGPYPPGRVKDLTAETGVPNEDGTGSVTLKFTAPADHFTDQYGYTFVDGLDNLTKIEITQYGYPVHTLLYTVENVEPGEACEVILENSPAGSNTYYVTAYNGANEEYSTTGANASGSYKSNTSVSAFVGYDTPAGVENLDYVYDGEKVSLSWTAPTKGRNGGYVLFDTIVYDVYRVYGTSYEKKLIAENLEVTEYVDVIAFEEPKIVSYQIAPKSMIGDTLTAGNYSSTSNMVVGPPVKLPFKESFANGSLENLWQYKGENNAVSSSTYLNSQWGTSTPFGTKVSDSYDSDGGAIYFSSYGDGSGYLMFYSCPITLEGTVNPVFRFQEWKEINESNQVKVEVVLIRANGEIVVLDTYDDYKTGETGWVEQEYSLKDYIEEDFINVGFKVYSDNQTVFALVDAIVVKDVYDFDLLLGSITAPKQVESGETFEVSAVVECNGSYPIDEFEVVLYRDGEEIDRQEGTSLEAEQAGTYIFSVTAHNSFSDETKFQVGVVCADDECANNDISDEIVTTIVKADVPAVSSLSANYVEPNKVTLSWEAPDYVLPEPETITDGFEDYDDWAPYDSTTEIMGTAIGGWTVINSNGCYKGNLDGKGNNYYVDNGNVAYPGAYSSPAYQVINTETLGVSEDYTGYWETYSGNKCLVSPDQQSYYSRKSDWLISPKLSGKAQTVTFYAQTYSGTAQQIMVYGSTTGNSVEEFTSILLGSIDQYGAEVPYNVSQIAVSGETYNSEFNEVEVEIPEGVKYFAIKCCTGYVSGSFLIIDDVTYEASVPGIPVELVGYNVYCDGVKVNEEVLTETTYEAAIEYGATHTYSVEAVYDLGSSEQVSAEAVSAPALELPAATLSGEGAESVVTLAWSAPAVSEGAAPVSVQKYVVYRNGEQLAETAEATYQDTLADYGQYTYTVKVVYDKGESELSNEFTYEYLEVVLPAVAVIGNIADNVVSLAWETPVVPDGKAAVTLEKYVVYSNGEQLAETTETRFTTELSEDGEYKFHVVVVYDKGESEASNEYVVAYSGIDSVVANAKVAVKDQTIVLNGVEGVNVMFASTDGKVVYSGVGTDVVEVPVVAGVYLVKIGKATTKVIVK